MEKITILTEPINIKLSKKISETYIRIKRFLFKEYHQKTNPPTFTGPDAVLKSLINGFNKLNIKYNLNPKKNKEIGETVIVLSNIEALKQAIKFKKNKKIKYLLAGPNLVVLPSENKDLICSRYIDTYLVNSEWTKRAYIDDALELKNKIAIWAAGVNANYWKPQKDKKKQVLVYIKSFHKKIIEQSIKLLEDNKFVVKIIKYGEYRPDQYLELLNKSKFAVFFSDSESQGIALFEAWSCNVPTLIWNRGFAKIHLSDKEKEKKVSASSAPYLTEKTGLFFKNAVDFKTKLKACNNKLKENFFCPREYIMQNFTDELSVKNLLDMIQKS